MSIDNRISLLKLEVFIAVVRHGGVGRAAQHLFVSQPVVSAHIKSLQEKVGAELFRKEGRALELTEAGHRVLMWAEDVIERSRDLGEELDALAEGLAGAVNFGATLAIGNYLLPDPLVEFAQRFPRVRVSMVQSTREAIVAGVTDAEVDFGIVIGATPLRSAKLTSTVLAHPELLVLAAVGSDVPARVTPEELSDLPFVCPPSGTGVREGQDAALAEFGVVRRNVVLEAGSAESIKRAVRGGLGVCVLSQMSVRDELAAGQLRRIEVGMPGLREVVYLLQRENKKFTPAQLALVNHLVREIRSLLA